MLVHNRTGKDEAFRKAVEKELDDLVESGFVPRAELWSRQQLAQEVFEAVYRRFLEQAPQTNLNYHDIYKWIEQVHWDPIEEVPLKSRVLSVDQYRLVSSSAERSRTADPCEEMLSANEKMAILIGPAGFGKSTAAFRLARGGAGRFLYIPAASITNNVTTTTDLFRQAISCAELLRDSLPEDYLIHEMIAREVIIATLKNGSLPLTIIFDGLDESVFFNKTGGIQHFMNLIKEELNVPVVLVARFEYWYRRETDFSTSIGLKVTKGPRKVRDILLIELLEWGEDKMLELLDHVRQQSHTPEQSNRLGLLEPVMNYEP